MTKNQLGHSLFKSYREISLLIVTLVTLTACQKDTSITALGTLERDRVLLKTTTNEVIVEALASEGQMVMKGEVILKLDDRRQKAMLAKAQAQVSIAQSQFELLQSGARIEDIDVARSKVNGAKAVLVAASKEFNRNKKLKAQGLISQSVLDQSLSARDTADANHKTMTEQLLALTNGTRKEELDQAEANVQAALAQLELEQLKLEELTIKATRDGYLDSLPYNVGERVSTGSVVAVVLANTQVFARVYIPEAWRVKLKVGDLLLVKVDGLEKTWLGKLRWIDSSPSFTPYYALNAEDRSRLVYLAEVDLPKDSDLPAGIPAQVLLKK